MFSYFYQPRKDPAGYKEGHDLYIDPEEYKKDPNLRAYVRRTKEERSSKIFVVILSVFLTFSTTVIGAFLLREIDPNNVKNHNFYHNKEIAKNYQRINKILDVLQKDTNMIKLKLYGVDNRVLSMWATIEHYKKEQKIVDGVQ